MKIFIAIVTFILLINIVSASYVSLTNDGDSNFDSTLFNNQLGATSVSSRTLDEAIYLPLYDDLDNNGDSEMFVLDGHEMILYDYDSILTEIVSESINCSSSIIYNDIKLSNVHIFDWDDDSKKEIILACNYDKKILVYEFNGTHINHEFEENYDSYDLNHQTVEDYTGESIIKCGSVGECALVINDYAYSTTSNSGQPVVIYFDNSGIITSKGLTYQSANGQATFDCFSKYKDIDVIDYDGDGKNEYTFTKIHVSTGGAGATDAWIYIFELNGTNVTEEASIEIDDLSTDLKLNGNCFLYGWNNQITSPVYGDFSSRSGYEILVAYNVDDDEFRIAMYDAETHDLIDEFPEVYQADGQIISNIAIGNFFYDNNNQKDFCVLGYDNVSEELDALCGSKDTGLTPETREFKMDVSQKWIIPRSDYRRFELHGGRTQASQLVTTNGGYSSNLDELVTPYGIVSLDWSDTYELQFGFNVYTLDMQYENPYGNGSVSIYDIEDTGYGDLIVMTENNIRYYDDGFINTQASIDGYMVNPCIDSQWQVNITSEVSITGIDTDSDNIRMRVILPINENYSYDSGWSNWYTSGTDTSFFIPINTTGTGELKLLVQDIENTNTNNSIAFNISVGYTGVETGDCYSTASNLYTSNTTTSTGSIGGSYNGTVSTDIESNVITDALDQTVERSGLGYTMIWLIIMSLSAFILYVYGSQYTSNVLPVIAGFEVLLLIMGVYLGYISAGLITILILVSIIIIGLYLRNKFFGGNRTF